MPRYYRFNRIDLDQLPKLLPWDWEEYFNERELLLNPYRYEDDGL